MNTHAVEPNGTTRGILQCAAYSANSDPSAHCKYRVPGCRAQNITSTVRIEAVHEQPGPRRVALVKMALPQSFGESLPSPLLDLISDHRCQGFLHADGLLGRFVPEEEGEQERGIGSGEFRLPTDILSMQGLSP
jgi:hypothetical protein